MVSASVVTLPDGRSLAYCEYGDPAGLPVLAFHGTPGGRHQLAPLDGDARLAGVRLIVPDRPGYGGSDLLRDRHLTDWPADIEVLTRHLGLARFALLGVSGGGPHALACAAALGNRVTATAVVSGVAPFTWSDVTAELPRLARPLAASVLRTPLLRALITIGLWLLRTWPRAIIAAYRRWLPPADVAVLDRPGLLEATLEGARRMSTTAARATVQDLRLFTRPWQIGLAGISTPVHIWHGDADQMVPVEHGRWLETQIPGSTFHPCPGDGHLCVVTRGAEVLGVLRRAAERSPGPSARRPTPYGSGS